MEPDKSAETIQTPKDALPSTASPGEGDAELKIILAAMKVLYAKETSDKVVAMLRAGDPVQSLANTALFVMRALYEQSNKSMPVDAAVTAADSIVDLMAELAQAAGVEIEDAGVEQAKAVVVQTLQQKMGQQAQPQSQVQPAQQQPPPAPTGGGLIASAMA